MKFPQYKTANTSTLHIPAITKGIEGDRQIYDCDNIALKTAKNVWIENGLLKTRPALETNYQRLIDTEQHRTCMKHKQGLTGVEIEIDSDIKRLYYQQMDCDISDYTCEMHLLNSDGTSFSTSEIHFNRVDDNTFFIPKKVHFYKGKPKIGSGVYGLFSLINRETLEGEEIRIFELSSDYSFWVPINSPYIPTVLINGRGNRYEISKATNQAFTGTPTRLEGINILDNSFYAYYSTDGRSSSFRLPFSNIADSVVVARLYYSVASYVTWSIGANETSGSTELYGVSVTMHINREKGIVNFTVPAGDYEMPLITDRNENNLRIFAAKTSEYSDLDIANSDVSITVNNKILFGNGNTVFEANWNNPLYFPAESVAVVGDKGTKINAFATLKDEAVVFKSNGVYSVKIKEGNKLATTSLLADNDADFYENDALSVKCVSRRVGCDKASAVISDNQQACWLGTDNRIYTLNPSGKITCAADVLPINGSYRVCAADFGEYSIFFNNSSAFAVGEKTGVFYWELPQGIEITDAYSQNGEPVIICRDKEFGHCFSGIFSGEKDSFISGNVYNITLISVPVETYIKTGRLMLGGDNSFKKLDWLVMRLKGSAEVSVNERFKACINCFAEEFGVVRLSLGLCNVNTIELAVCAQNPIELGSIDIKYTSLKL